MTPATHSGSPHEQKPIAERFAIALDELVGMCLESGMHTADLIGPLKKELAWAREQTARVDRQGGATDEQIRESLQLEQYEPIPSAEPRTT